MDIQKKHTGKTAVLGTPVPQEQILQFLDLHPKLRHDYDQLPSVLQQEFLDFCRGAAGLKVCYDPFFKFLFNVDVHPNRLSGLLSAILGETVLVQKVLLNEGNRIVADSSLVVMDVVVELSDGALANVEIQKIPYLFPGQRAACYSSDLLLRQYSRARSRKRGVFSYKELRQVYTIVILESSGAEFHEFPDHYIHRASQVFDTGLNLELLQKYLYIPLDVFREIHHNKDIETELDAWLAFLAFDDPEHIWQIQNSFPAFRELYADMVEFRKDVGEVLKMFSEALAIMDKNTVDYMIEEQRKEIERQKKLVARNDAALAREKKTVRRLDAAICEKDAAICEKDAAIARLSAELESLKSQLGED